MLKVGTRVLRIDQFNAGVFQTFLKETNKKPTDIFTITDTDGQYCTLDHWKNDKWGSMEDLYFDLDNFKIASDPLFYSEGLDNDV